MFWAEKIRDASSRVVFNFAQDDMTAFIDKC